MPQVVKKKKRKNYRMQMIRTVSSTNRDILGFYLFTFQTPFLLMSHAKKVPNSERDISTLKLAG